MTSIAPLLTTLSSITPVFNPATVTSTGYQHLPINYLGKPSVNDLFVCIKKTPSRTDSKVEAKEPCAAARFFGSRFREQELPTKRETSELEELPTTKTKDNSIWLTCDKLTWPGINS